MRHDWRRKKSGRSRDAIALRLQPLRERASRDAIALPLRREYQREWAGRTCVIVIREQILAAYSGRKR